LDVIWLLQALYACSELWRGLLLQGRLDDECLSLLVDGELTVLDIARTQKLTAEGICIALKQLPILTALDLSFTAFKPALLTSLASWCPRLEVCPQACKLQPGHRPASLLCLQTPGFALRAICHADGIM
jgi:hypothetical protein